jgi:hypothetical protein
MLPMLIMSVGAFRCSTDDDCEQLGRCNAGTGECACEAGFSGETCGKVDVAPLAAPRFGKLWPAPGDTQANSSAWGASVVFDESDGLYHSFVDVACGGRDGVLASGGGSSWIAHLTSTSPTHGAVPVRRATPLVTFGPHLSRAPGGGPFVAIFRVNALPHTNASSYPLCLGNGAGTDPLPPGHGLAAQPPHVRASQISTFPGADEHGQNMFVMWADRMMGPWQVARVHVEGVGGLHLSNPSLAFPRAGGVLMAFRYNPPGGSTNGVASATNWTGPFRAIANLTAAAHGSEDPFIFERSSSLHMLWHAGPHGFHGWSTDGGSSWSVAAKGRYAFELHANASGAQGLKFKRRERPELLFDDGHGHASAAGAGRPLYLVTGVQEAASGVTYSLAQPINAPIPSTPRRSDTT